MYTINGTGTKLFGKQKTKDENYYISTKWFSLFFFPVIPLKSYRVKLKNESAGFFSISKEYDMQPISLETKQIVFTYLKTLFIGPALSIYLPYIIFELIYYW